MAELAFSLAIGLLLALALLPALVFCAQIFALMWPSSHEPSKGSRRPAERLAVLIPAHDEARGIVHTIGSVLPQLGANDLILVVADNCSDDTAEAARRAGATVTERFDSTRRGKGYALDHGVRHLARHAPTHVLMIDADCQLHPGSINALMQAVQTHQGPVQACDLMQAPPGAPVKTKVAEFAWLVKNMLRPLGGQRLGWPCQLMGTGMIFPWEVIANAPLASGHLAEDMQLGAHLAQQGIWPRYCQDALVTSRFPSDAQAIAAQRQRWEHGHLSTIGSAGLPLLWQGLRQRRWSLIGMALDMSVPPLTTVLLLAVVALLGSLVAAALATPGALGLLTVSLSNALLLGLALSLAWRMGGHRALPLRDVLSIPTYVLSKLSIYASFITRKQTQWIRARRDDRDH